jgi:hypothetical protein
MSFVDEWGMGSDGEEPPSDPPENIDVTESREMGALFLVFAAALLFVAIFKNDPPKTSPPPTPTLEVWL